MRYPWANVALLALLVFQFVTGFLGLINGAEPFRWVLRLHDIGGYAIAVLLFWKGLIIFDVLNRVRRINFARAVFLFQTALFILILVTGLVWPVLGYQSLSGFSLMTIHALLALALVGFLAWHTLARRFVFKSPTLRERRAFLRFAGIAMAGLASWQVAEVAAAVLQWPGAMRRFTGSYPQGEPGVFPVVSWIADDPPPVERATWQLVVEGEVERPFSLSYDEVERLANDSIQEMIDCTGGWYSSQEWTGIPLARLLERAEVKASAQSVTIEAVSGYSRRFSLAEAPRLLLATRVAGQVLDHGHGFPLRLIAPGHRGFEWVKWVTRVEVNDTSEIWQTPVPLQ